MDTKSLLSHIAQLPHSRATFKQLVRELHARGEARDDLQEALDRLVDRGDLVSIGQGRYVVTESAREYAVGRLKMHRDGFGFLIADKPVPGVQGDIYIP